MVMRTLTGTLLTSFLVSTGVVGPLIVLLVVVLVLWYGTVPRRLPPGPYGLPFLGCIPYLQVPSPHFILERWAKRYGPVMSFYMGGHLVVVLNDRRVMDETLVKQSEAYAGRPPILLPQPKRIRKGHGLITSDGELWREQRRFAARTLRDFFSYHSHSSFEENLHSEVRHLLSSIQALSLEQTTIDLYQPIARTASGVMCKLLFGRSFEDEQSLQAQVERINYRNAAANVHPLSAILFMPWLLQLPFLRKRMEKFLREGDEIAEFFQNRIDEAASSYDSQKQPANYVHAFLKARENGMGHYFTDDQLLPAAFQLFVGGTETMTTTLRWALYLMAKYPEVQESVFNEIATKLGDASSNGRISKRDMAKLPFTQATVMEVMRLATVLPMSAMHRTTTETTVDGYVIPANTRVIPFLYNVHRDEMAFPDPLRFNPSRFLQTEETLVNNPSWIPYGLGKRACPATSVAKVEVLVIFACLIQAFRFSFSPSEKSDDIDECIVGFSHCAPSRRLLVVTRSDAKQIVMATRAHGMGA